jgi:hypothetical protein
LALRAEVFADLFSRIVQLAVRGALRARRGRQVDALDARGVDEDVGEQVDGRAGVVRDASDDVGVRSAASNGMTRSVTFVAVS